MLTQFSRWAAAALVSASPALAQMAPAPCDKCAPPEEKKAFADVPPIQPFPRPGYFAILPTGPGDYSALDWITGESREKPPKYPYPRFSLKQNSFFDIDWRYLDDPKNTEHDYFDCLKRIKLHDCVMFTTGGDLRYRYNSEANSRLSNMLPERFRGADNDYSLTRLRVYGDLWVTDNFRLYVEYIDAQSFEQDFPNLPIDRTWGDLLNAFIDVRTLTIDEHPVWLRVGRQELLYGSQRLISPLEWANTRRTFQGVKAFWQGDKVSIDAFAVNPVIPNTREFDWVDDNLLLSGVWATYRPEKTRALDLYLLNINRRNSEQTGNNGIKGDANVTTLGSRYSGSNENNWLWDVEGMVQYGRHSNQSKAAYSVTAAGGYHFKNAWSSPSVWLSYDHASGDSNPGAGGANTTFDQLFPFGHYYFGFIDVVGRRNIHDLSVAATAYPTNWITAQAQFHNFFLDRPADALYNAAGLPIRQDKTGRSGRFVGQEVDLLMNFHLSNHQDILISYSYLFAGDFLRNTATTPAGQRDPHALYVQYTYRW